MRRKRTKNPAYGLPLSSALCTDVMLTTLVAGASLEDKTLILVMLAKIRVIRKEDPGCCIAVTVEKSTPEQAEMRSEANSQ